MPRSLPALALVLLSGCGGKEVLAPESPCAPFAPSSHWPAEAGVLQLAPSPQALPFTPAPHRAPPPILVPNPVVIARPRIVTVIAAGDPFADTVEAYADAVPDSAWWTAVTSEYGISAARSGIHVRGPEMPSTMAGNDIVAYVRAALETATSDASPDGATVYLVPLAPGTDVVDVGRNQRNCGCAMLSGVHFAFDDRGDEIAIAQRCSSSDVDALTSTMSHEIVESVTDPEATGGFLEPRVTPVWDGSVWAGNEVTDLCGGTRIHEQAWEYPRSFSNLAARRGDDPCAPPLIEPYYNVTAPEDWYAVAPGGTVSVDVVGWSTAPRDDWFVYVPPTLQTSFDITLVSDESAIADGFVFYGINNGKKATLTVTATSAPSGASTIVQLYSRPSSPGSDVLHIWRVGFYVP